MQTNPSHHPTHHSGQPIPSSKQHLNLPQLSEYNEDEYAGFFLQSFYKNVSHVRQISRPFNIPILKQEIDTLLSTGDLSPNILAFLITYIRNSLEQLKIEKLAYMLGINVTNYSKADKKITYEYLQTLTNPYKGFKTDLVKSGINLFISFFYNGRWVLCVLDPKKGKCNMIDFLDKSLTLKGANDELYEVIKAYLRDEFDIKPSSVSFFDKFKREKTENCGVFVAKFLANFFFGNLALEKITITDDEKNQFKKILAWLIIKIDPPREESSASLRSGDKSYQNMLPHDILKGHRASKPISSMKTIRGMVEETKEDQNKVRLTKDELAAMLDKVKAEVIEEMGSDDGDLSDFLEKEGLFNDSKYSTEVLSQSHLRELIKKAKKKKEKLRLQKEHNEQNKPVTYEEYMQQMYDYQKQVSEFHGMLSYFQRFNPQMYTRIAQELNGQVEDRLLEKFNMLHVKYPDNNSDQPRQSRMGSSLPSASSHNRLASLGRASLGVFNPNLYPSSANSKSDPSHYTIYNHQAQPRGSNALISAMSRGSTVVSPYDFVNPPHQLSFGSPEKPLSSMTSRTTQSSQSGSMGGVTSPLFNAGKALLGGEKRVSGAQNPQIVARRYGMTITREDYKRFKMENSMSNEIMSFYLGYLREKQRFIDPQRMKIHELNVFYFGNEFYQMLTSGRPAATNINYESVKNMTGKYSGNNKTIFDIFHKIVFVIRMTAENYALVYVNNADKKIYLFDPNKPRDSSPHENPVLLNILHYIDFEYQDKIKKKIDIKKWQLLYGNVMKANNPRDSGVIVAKIAHSVQKGAVEGNYADEVIWKFKSDFIDLILKIGIAEDPKENMSWIAQHVI